MRKLAGIALLVAAAACSADEERTKSYDFGPITVAPNQEINDQCVQISLKNEDYVNVNVVELTTGPGFHHSNWFFVPQNTFSGPNFDQNTDGIYRCNDRLFDQAVAAIKGGVFFAQSTQAPHEIQAFPPGAVVRIPPYHKLVAQIHLLNPTDAPLQLSPNIKVTSLPEDEVTTKLAGVSFQNQALALPPNMRSKFSVECDLRKDPTEADPNKLRPAWPYAEHMKLYYALAHYHELGTALTFEAVKPTGERATIYTTQGSAGHPLGGLIDPQFDFTGYTKIRFSCEYYNPRSEVVKWGVGDQEMCVFLAFSDSQYKFGGGLNEEDIPLDNPQLVGNMMTYENTNCAVFAGDNDNG